MAGCAHVRSARATAQLIPPAARVSSGPAPSARHARRATRRTMNGAPITPTLWSSGAVSRLRVPPA
eukprot:1808009-Prymnesium_polylepis.1